MNFMKSLDKVFSWLSFTVLILLVITLAYAYVQNFATVYTH